jgi:hypothetical protein
MRDNVESRQAKGLDTSHCARKERWVFSDVRVVGLNALTHNQRGLIILVQG